MSRLRIAITGKEGQVARAMTALGPSMGAEILAVRRAELDLADPGSVHPALAAVRPEAIVSAAAYTAVDKAETESDLACLKAEGCNEGQGYLFSKAQPQAEVMRLLKEMKKRVA